MQDDPKEPKPLPPPTPAQEAYLKKIAKRAAKHVDAPPPEDDEPCEGCVL